MIQKVVFPQKKQFPLKRTAAYARVSSGKDAMLHSLSSQVSYYNQLIQSNPEWLFCGVYADERNKRKPGRVSKVAEPMQTGRN